LHRVKVKVLIDKDAISGLAALLKHEVSGLVVAFRLALKIRAVGAYRG
jgi:hypothetical protein